MPALTTADKTKHTFFSNSVPEHNNNSVQSTFPGSLTTRKPTVSQQPHLGSLTGMMPAVAVPYVQGAASLPMKSPEQKPAAGIVYFVPRLKKETQRRTKTEAFADGALQVNTKRWPSEGYTVRDNNTGLLLGLVLVKLHFQFLYVVIHDLKTLIGKMCNRYKV